MTARAECELCRAEIITPRFFDSERFWIALCISCNEPLAVAVEHVSVIDGGTYLQMAGELEEVARQFFTGRRFFIDNVMRQIPDHYHMHARLDPRERLLG